MVKQQSSYILRIEALTSLKRILVVDGDGNFRRSLRIDLEESGYQVTEDNSYLQAEKRLSEQIFDYVIIDIEPVLQEGIELAEFISLVQPETNVIFTSSYNYSEFYSDAFLIGKYPFFVKPFDVVELIEILESLNVIEQ